MTEILHLRGAEAGPFVDRPPTATKLTVAASLMSGIRPAYCVRGVLCLNDAGRMWVSLSVDSAEAIKLAIQTVACGGDVALLPPSLDHLLTRVPPRLVAEQDRQAARRLLTEAHLLSAEEFARAAAHIFGVAEWPVTG